MTLTEYMKLYAFSDQQMAGRLDCSEAAIRKWRRGERIPRPDQMRRIFEATDGKVTASDFFARPSSEPEVAA